MGHQKTTSLNVKLIKYLLIILQISVLLCPVYASDPVNEQQAQLERTAYIISSPLFEVDMDEIQKILEILLLESNFKAFQITDSLEQTNILLSSWIENDSIKHRDEDFPSDYEKPSINLKAYIRNRNVNIGIIIGYLGDPLETFKTIDLSEEERAFLHRRSNIKIAILDNYEPFSFKTIDGYEGLSVDIYRLIAQKTGMSIELLGNNWPNNFAKFKNGEVDIIDAISYKPERTSFTLYTKPYHEIPTIILVREDFGTYKDINSLKGRAVAITKNIFFAPELKKIDGIDVREYLTREEQVRDLVYGKVDAVINSYHSCNGIISRNGYTGLKVVSELEITGVEKEDLRIGVRKDLPILFGIIQKGFEAIS